MMLTEYSSRLSRLLQAPPAPGEGHRWLFRVSVSLRQYHTREAVTKFLKEAAALWPHRQPPAREIEAAIADAFAFEGSGPGAPGVPLDWFEPDAFRIANVVATTRPLFDPAARTGMTAAQALQFLFQPDDLVCLAGIQTASAVMPAREALGVVDQAQFMVPSPMAATTGTNKAGKASVRCDSNVRIRRHLVLEFDEQDKATQAAVLSHLAAVLPLVLAVDSAGKSIHGWFRVEGVDDYTLRDFMSYAIGLGADPHTWVRSQLVRAPGGLRYREGHLPERQEIVFVGN